MQEEVVPGLVLPDGLKPKGLDVQPEEIAFDLPLTPSYPLQPPPPPYDKPLYGADWTGLKPFQVSPEAVVADVTIEHMLSMPCCANMLAPHASCISSDNVLVYHCIYYWCCGSWCCHVSEADTWTCCETGDNAMMQETEPVMAADAALPVIIWQHPPATLPKLPHGVSPLQPVHTRSKHICICVWRCLHPQSMEHTAFSTNCYEPWKSCCL